MQTFLVQKIFGRFLMPWQFFDTVDVGWQLLKIFRISVLKVLRSDFKWFNPI